MCMPIVKAKLLITHLVLSNISLFKQLSRALLKLKYFTRLHKSWIHKSYLIKKRNIQVIYNQGIIKKKLGKTKKLILALNKTAINKD